MRNDDFLPPFTSTRPCPRCKELLHWDTGKTAVNYDTRTGFVSHVTLFLYCIACGYRENGFVNIDKAPVWTEERDV